MDNAKNIFKVFCLCAFIAVSTHSRTVSSNIIRYNELFLENLEVICHNDYYDVFDFRFYTINNLIDNSELYNKLNSKKKKFIKSNLRDWIEVSILYNISVELIIAQAFLESGVGNSTLYENYNAMYGIKSYSRKDRRSIALYDNLEKRSARYKAYNSVRESILDHADLLNRRYKPLIGENWYDATRIVKQLGYATDPDYTFKLRYIIKKYLL